MSHKSSDTCIDPGRSQGNLTYACEEQRHISRPACALAQSDQRPYIFHFRFYWLSPGKVSKLAP